MSKIKLNVEALAVESFDTTHTHRQKGTVFGEECTCWTQCGQNTCPGCPTCDATCAYTCDDVSCANSCEGTCHGISCFTRCIDSCICP